MFISQREFKEHIQQQRSSQNRLKEQRQQIARAKKYHREYHVQHRARLMRARTKEEKVGSKGCSHSGKADIVIITIVFFILFFFTWYCKVKC